VKDGGSSLSSINPLGPLKLNSMFSGPSLNSSSVIVVGSSEGASDGLSDGSPLGSLEGLSMGSFEGSVLGSLVGSVASSYAAVYRGFGRGGSSASKVVRT
jgi:hypothetical protein